MFVYKLNFKIIFLGLIFLINVNLFSGITLKSSLFERDTSYIGGFYQGSIIIQNIGDEKELIHIYQNDYLFYADGSNQFGEPGSYKRSNASWIKIDTEKTYIAPGMDKEIKYSVNIPSGVELTGTYWSLIMVQTISNSALDPNKSKETIKVTEGTRYGIQIVTDIGTSGSGKINFSNIKKIEIDGKAALQVDIENTGDKLLGPEIYIEFYSKSGIYAGRITDKKYAIYPDCSRRSILYLDSLKPGDYKGQLIADAGSSDIFGIICSVTINDNR